jgi:hypothetical protein
MPGSMVPRHRPGVPGAHPRRNDPGNGMWGAPEHRERSQFDKFRGRDGHPIRGKSLPYEPDYDRTIKVANVEPVPAGQESAPYTILWPHGGLVVGMQATTLADGSALGMSSIGIKISAGDGRESFLIQAASTGATTDSFTSLLSLCGANNERRFLFKRPVYPQLSWEITFKNFAAVDGPTYTPEVVFFVDSDPGEIRRYFFKKVAVPAGCLVEVYGANGKRVIDTSDR